MQDLGINELAELLRSTGRRAVICTLVAKTKSGRHQVNCVLGPRDSEGFRSWGVRVPGTCLVEHKGNLYVELLVNSRKQLDDNEPPEQIGKLRDYRLDSIELIRINHQEYRCLT